MGDGQRPEKVDIFKNNIIMESIKLEHLTENEMKNVNGGGIWKKFVNALESAYDWCKDKLNIDIQIGRVD